MSDPTREKYTPTTDDVRHGYRYGNQDIGGDLYMPEESDAEFDRWLESERRAARAEGWLEGYQQGYCVEPRPDWANAHSNPYRQEADQ